MNQPNQKHSPVPLEVTSGKALLEMDIPPTKFIVADLLPVGLHLLAGSPKIGKSWLALFLCNQVSHGLPMWQFETRKCTTLYLSLEDTLDRLHYRLSSISETASEDAFFATKADSLSGMLPEQLDAFIQSHPDIGLIVIDTFARVRNNTEKVSYLNDYEEMGKFKAIADTYKLAIILVHHLRKMPDSDPVNMISGSTGLVGAVDDIYILEKDSRLDNKAKLHITGRDMQDMQLNLEFDREANVWKFLSFASGEVEQIDSRILSAIGKLLDARGAFNGTATDLLTAMREHDGDMEITPNHLSRLLNQKTLVLEKAHGIILTTKRTNSARLLMLVKAGDGDDSLTPQGV